MSRTAVVPLLPVGPTPLTTKQAAKFLQVSVTTMYRLVKNREIACIKLNGPLRFEMAALHQFLSRRRVKPQ